MSQQIVNSIAGRLSLRPPQRHSLEILARLCELDPPRKGRDPATTLANWNREYPGIQDFERDFPSICFSLATGVGKTRLMGAFIAYLHLAHKVNHFFVLAPNLTIYNKLIADFTANTPKYVFKGIAEFAQDPPQVITGDNYERADVARGGVLIEAGIQVNIFNISKINSEVRGGNAPRIKRLSEYIGESYFEYLADLPDLVLLMDESHRYRASAGIKAINELKPTIGLELTATPFTEKANKQVSFQNVVFHYPLAQAMADGFVKEPAVVTQKNFRADQFGEDQLEQIKLEDGIRVHENTKVELATFSQSTGRPQVKPFMLVVARDTQHADALQKRIETLFEGRYVGKVIQVHSNQQGEEKEEVVQKLLAVESPDEPTEIVVHVNMLKEGWDVTNLYTIVPLRSANARTLVEQSIGRGLRLPYGKKTGVNAVDTLNIIAHDNFQKIVDEANRGDSILRLKTVELEPGVRTDRLVSIAAKPAIETALEQTVAQLAGQQAGERDLTRARAIYDTITDWGKYARSAAELKKPEVQAKIVEAAQSRYEELLRQSLGTQDDLPGFQAASNPPSYSTHALVAAITETFIDKTIDIPRILVVPQETVRLGFGHFDLDTTTINYQPVSRELLLQLLRTNEQATITTQAPGQQEERLEDYLVRGLIDLDDISYDDHADILYNLSSQIVAHLRSYLADDGAVENVLRYHQRELVRFIHAQMQAHRNEHQIEYQVEVRQGYTKLKPMAYTAVYGEDHLDVHRTDFDKSKIGRLVFTGFQRSLYNLVKFDSDTERRFALILERDSQKWLKPAKGQFQIHYQNGSDLAEYVPDFVAETIKAYYMIETKAKDELSAPEVQAKKAAAEQWCSHATKNNTQFGGKPWKYLLIPHDQVQDNMDLDFFAQARVHL